MSNRQTIKVIQRFLRSSISSTPLNKTWMSIVDQWGIGQISNGFVYLSDTDKQALRVRCEQQTGIDPLVASLEGDRVAIAESGANEKLSNVNVFANFVQIARPNGKFIRLKKGVACTPPGTLLSVDLDEVNLEDFSHVIIIENGSVIKYWDNICLPSNIEEPLFIYRGHGINARPVVNLISSSNHAFTKVGFFDLDPAGICLGAKREGFDELLMPDFESMSADSRHKLQKKMKEHSFLDQCSAALAQEHLLTDQGKKLLKRAIEQKWSITQELMISLKIPLMTECIKDQCVVLVAT